MSLNRVASIETLSDHHVRRGSDASYRPRKLSFSPIPQAWDPPQPALNSTSDEQDFYQPGQRTAPISAFEVAPWTRILQISAAVVYCLLSAGVVFGYAAIKPVLKDEGAYKDYCPDGDDSCVEIHLNLMFTVAAVATNVVSLPVGALLDNYGPRLCSIVGSFFLAAGCLIMAYATVLPFDGFLVGYLCLALGGPFTFIPTFQLSNAFPRHSGLILALLTGAFDSSSAIFLIYRILYNATDGVFNHERFFLIYLIVPATILMLQFFLMPSKPYKTVGDLLDQGHEAMAETNDDRVTEETELLRDEMRDYQGAVVADIQSLLGSVDGGEQVKIEEKKNAISGVWGVLHDRTVLEQLRSPWFILICLFTVIQMTRINYFVATVRPQYQAILGDVDKAIKINEFFDIALPVGGILSVPFIGLILDNTSTVTVLSILVTVATTIGVLGLLPYMWAAYANIMIFVMYRPFYYTAVSDYTAKVMGFRTFGTIYGLIICLSGLFNLCQPLLDVLFHRTFNNSPMPVNVILLTAGLVCGVCLVSFVSYKVQRRNKVGHWDDVSRRYGGINPHDGFRGEHGGSIDTVMSENTRTLER